MGSFLRRFFTYLNTFLSFSFILTSFLQTLILPKPNAELYNNSFLQKASEYNKFQSLYSWIQISSLLHASIELVYYFLNFLECILFFFNYWLRFYFARLFQTSLANSTVAGIYNYLYVHTTKTFMRQKLIELCLWYNQNVGATFYIPVLTSNKNQAGNFIPNPQREIKGKYLSYIKLLSFYAVLSTAFIILNLTTLIHEYKKGCNSHVLEIPSYANLSNSEYRMAEIFIIDGSKNIRGQYYLALGILSLILKVCAFFSIFLTDYLTMIYYFIKFKFTRNVDDGNEFLQINLDSFLRFHMLKDLYDYLQENATKPEDRLLADKVAKILLPLRFL